jgi:CheY-like chemotaxis protein
MTDAAAGKRVLVVEDELLVAMGLEMVLTDAGCHVVGPIGRLDEAMAAAATEEVDVALLDVNLRGHPVFPVADALAARGIPFVFLTGYGRETLPASHAHGRMLSKPFEATELVAVVADAARP